MALPDRYTLQAWAREGVLGLADWLFRFEQVLYEDVLGHPPTPTLDGQVLYDDGQVRLVYAPETSPTGLPYRLRVKISERCWTEEVVSAAELRELTRRFNDHLVTLVFEHIAKPGEGLPWDDLEDAVRSF